MDQEDSIQAESIERVMRQQVPALFEGRYMSLNVPALTLGGLLDPKWMLSFESIPADEFAKALELARELGGEGQAGTLTSVQLQVLCRWAA